jgi:uncharacterized membrane protein
LIYAYVALSALQVLGAVIPPLQATVGIVGLVAIVPLGIISIVFAVKLLRLPNNLHGMLKPFSYMSIATGFCYALIILMPLALLTSVIADIILGIIFLQSVDEAPSTTMEGVPIKEGRKRGSGPYGASRGCACPLEQAITGRGWGLGLPPTIQIVRF